MVNTGDKLVMVDCGGAKKLGPTAGRLPQALAQLGVDPGVVDEVYITHMHGDHLHGATYGDRLQTFEAGAELTPGIQSVNAHGHEFTVGFDHNQDDTRAKRRGLFEMAARENILIAAVHLPFPGIGR